MKMMFIHDYPGERSAINCNGVECIYAGAPGANKNVDFVLGESPLLAFDDPLDGENLSWPFEFIHSYQHFDLLLLTLPLSLTKDIGKGYVLELLDYIGEAGYPEVHMIQARYPQFGCPLEGTILYLMVSKNSLNIPKSINVKESVVSDLFPTIITHAETNPQNIAFTTGSGTMNGFIKSNANPFPPMEKWRESVLLVEKRNGNTLSTERLSKEDLRKLFGVSMEDDPQLINLRRVVPNRVHEAVIKTFVL